MKRLTLLLLGCLIFGAAGGTVHAAADGAPTFLQVSRESDTVSGEPVQIRALLSDARDRPVPGALIRLTTIVTFAGEQRELVMDETRTGEEGVATLMFAPTDVGRARVAVGFAGHGEYGPAEASLVFDVVEPVVAFDLQPPGIDTFWTRSYLILIPLAGIWLAYAIALSQAFRVRHAGAQAGRR